MQFLQLSQVLSFLRLFGLNIDSNAFICLLELSLKYTPLLLELRSEKMVVLKHRAANFLYQESIAEWRLLALIARGWTRQFFDLTVRHCKFDILASGWNFLFVWVRLDTRFLLHYWER